MPSSNPADGGDQPKSGITDIHISELTDLHIDRPATRAPEGGKVTQVGGHNIVTVTVPIDQTVNSFEPGRLRSQTGLRYSDVLEGADSARKTKNARFRISDLARGPLSVAEEEEERIENEVKARVAARLNELADKARKTAQEEGFASGLSDGRANAAAEAKPRLETFEKLLAEFESMRHEIFKANEEFLIRMTYRLAKAVILRELKEDNDYTKRLVVQLLERVGTRENIKIFVGEKVFSSAEALKEGVAQSLGQLKNISVELDTTMSHEGCRVETDFGEIDARIEVQIQNIAQAMGVSVS